MTTSSRSKCVIMQTPLDWGLCIFMSILFPCVHYLWVYYHHSPYPKKTRLSRLHMELEIKWYSKYVFLVGALLSFADPITDILNLVQFYREDHKAWFAVSLGFLFLPWVPFGYYYVLLERPFTMALEQRKRAPSCKWLKSFLIGFHPFAAAVARLKMFVFCLKNRKETGTNHAYSQAAALVEAVLESAPQFVIQLYVISIQHERVSVIQLASLPVSFLSLASGHSHLSESSILDV